MSDRAVKDVYVFCERCKRNVLVRVPTITERRVGGLLKVVSTHGLPEHGIVAYLDSQFRVRDVEYPDSATGATLPDTETGMAAFDQTIIDTEMGLRHIVASLGDKEKEGIRALAMIISHLLTRRPVILVHADPEIRSKFASSIIGLFSRQSVPVEAVNHGQLAEKDMTSTCVFDLNVKRFLNEGAKIKSGFIEEVVRELLNETKGYLGLSNELSKILYSYQQVKQILSSGDAPILDTKLAKDASIDLSLLPIILDMAHNEGIKAKSRVVQDNLARAIRSI